MKTQAQIHGARFFRVVFLACLVLNCPAVSGCANRIQSNCARPSDCATEASIWPQPFAESSARHENQGDPVFLGAEREPASTVDLGMSGFDPGVPGPEQTVSFDLEVTVSEGPIQLTVVGPSDDGKEITLRDAPHPLVVLSPGFTIDRKQYTHYGARLASYGLVAVLQNSGNELNHAAYRDGTIALLNWLASPTGTDATRLQGRLDLTRLGLAGHSLGGKISVLVAAQDTRIKALFGIDPVDGNTPPALPVVGKIELPTGIPLAFIGETISESGTPPCAPAGENYAAFYNDAPSPAFAITVVGAAHGDFVDNFVFCLTCGFCPGGTAPKARTNALAVKYAAAYFLWTLAGNAQARDYFTSVAFQSDIALGYITLVQK
jgi:pimeloyl-ACP methyl ester carboxylesterase